MAWYLIGWQIELYVFLVSCFAITMSQLILRDGDRDTKAIQLKLDEVLRAIPEADNNKIGIEQKQ